MNIKNFSLIFILIFIFTACSSSVTPVSNKAISKIKIEKKNNMDLLDEQEDYEQKEDNSSKELYFEESKGRIFYSGLNSSKDNFEYRTELLLNNLFHANRKNLPRKSRRKKLNIALEIDKNSFEKEKLLLISQEYILSKKRFSLSNGDFISKQVLQKVLRAENDSIFKKNKKINSKFTSDFILFIKANKIENEIIVLARLISKNGTILGQKQSRINLLLDTKEWIEVKVPRNDGPSQIFEVMKNAVTYKQYKNSSLNRSITNISFISANSFCKKNMGAELLYPYVFEYARRDLSLIRPSSNANVEIMAPYDEEEHESYFQEGDNLEVNDSDIVSFHWNSEKYFSVSNLFKSSNATFRCMRVK